MTLPQIKGFLEAIAKKTAQANAMSVINTAVGAQGDSKAIKKTVQGYQTALKKGKEKRSIPIDTTKTRPSQLPEA